VLVRRPAPTPRAAFEVLSQHHPRLKEFDWARLTFELEAYLDEIHEILNAIYHPH